ncbi:hypothetical protein ABI59_06905 [Acidobacteria bacterium Mor1]|nr:hypothetical protein ABI59_06905 [Acidobacteria bacterium Mor1]
MSIALDTSLAAATAAAATGLAPADPGLSGAGAPAPGSSPPLGSDEEGTRPGELSEADRKKVRELQARDREVRAHEAAHQAAAGDLAQGVSYEFERGPDGKLYAVGGEVKIDTSPVPGDPQATIEKAERIVRAALAPAEPSGKDRQVAARARQMAAKARIELAKDKAEEAEELGRPAEAPAEATPYAIGSRSSESSRFLDLLA